MKIPTWLLAVGAYLLLRPKGGESASTDIPPKKAAPGAAKPVEVAPGVVVTAPTDPKAPVKITGRRVGRVGDGWAAMSKPVSLQTDTRYFARLALSGIESVATASMIREKLESVGFKDVHVWMDDPPESAPDGVKGKPGPFVLGTWSNPPRTANLVSEIAEMWGET